MRQRPAVLCQKFFTSVLRVFSLGINQEGATRHVVLADLLLDDCSDMGVGGVHDPCWVGGTHVADPLPPSSMCSEDR
jgi:hypothetical protein